jgi:hypothetical protein
MAQLNVFKSTLFTFGTADQDIYVAPAGYTAIILNAQCANVSANEATVEFKIYDSSANTTNELVKNLTIPGNDAANLATGKLVLESGDKLTGLSDTNGVLKLTLSYLESLDA